MNAVIMEQQATGRDSPAFLIGQGECVLHAIADDGIGSDAVRGLAMLAKLGWDHAVSAEHTNSCEAYEQASVTLACLIGLMNTLDAECCGSTLFYAAMSLLTMAKSDLDQQWLMLEQSDKEVAHA